jgi:hypothetical protein
VGLEEVPQGVSEGVKESLPAAVRSRAPCARELTGAGKPLAIDLFCGLGGWTDGLLAVGWDVVGFDLERHRAQIRVVADTESGVKVGGIDFNGYGMPGYKAVAFNGTAAARLGKPIGGWNEYPAQLVLQDVLTIHGSQFRDAALIVASPPCQKYSYLAMPWSRSSNPENSKAAKALRKKWETEGPDNRLFNACFRIQREAIEATRPDCPICKGDGVDPNLIAYRRCRNCGGLGKVGVGRHIPLIVENVRGAQPWVGRSAWNYGSFHLWGDVPALMPITLGRRAMKRGVVPGQKVPAYSDPRRNGGKGVHLTSPQENADGTKIGGDWFGDPNSTCRKHGSRSNARKQASAMIAKIPRELAEWIARVYYPLT